MEAKPLGDFIVDADVLANARFGTSQFAESVAALKMLLKPHPEPWFRAWHDAHAGALRAAFEEHPIWAAIAGNAFSPGWAADFYCLPPVAPNLDLGAELEPMLALPDERIREDLAYVRTPLAAGLSTTPGLAGHAAALLRWVWAEAVAPEWPRRRSVLQADIVSRTARLGEQGWSGALHDLGPDVRWLGNGRIQVNRHVRPPLDIRGRDLMFIAVHTLRVGVNWALPDRYALTYPVTGIFATTKPLAEPLVRLLGRNRARVLIETAEPISTSALVATTGLALATVADHLRVLLDAGLLEHRRSGRQVLYWQTSTGRLVASSEAVSGK